MAALSELSVAALSECSLVFRHLRSFLPTPLALALRELKLVMSQTAALTPLSVSNVCAAYLRAQFQYKLNARSSGTTATQPDYPLMLPLGLVSELDIIADALLCAFLERG